MSRNHTREAGFTLIELMISVAIVGVLAALTTTNYQIYIERVRVARAIVEIKQISTYLDVVDNDGGTLPASLAAVRLAQNDPWGRSYEYLPIRGNPGAFVVSRKDQFNVPLNSDFDLFSRGRDGLTQRRISHAQSVDDVVRGANGAFIGLARNY